MQKNENNRFNIISDSITLKQSSGAVLDITNGDILTYFINGNPDITEDVKFIGVSEGNIPLFIALDDDGNERNGILMIGDTENLFLR